MRLIAATLAIVFGLVGSAFAEDAFKEGVHYQKLAQKVATVDPSKIEVTEVFWYGCGHCYTFEPMLQSWKAEQAEDVNVVQLPAIWNGPMEVHAKAFFTAKALNKLDTLHQPLFDALNSQRARLDNEQALVDFFEKHGVSEEDFRKTYRSFGVVSQVNIANSKARGYGITGTPEVIVDGQYRISARMAGSQEKMLQVADFLVEKIRNSQGS
ncbi:thiol:disulfide interchange protein DsbA/DsbL [Halioxenophilus aromaticivorans]|uniref:Thiol:disulfide interchange protein n=1 Tax=Halioxenophilus aromaticivorans TaxID=1306992 RepID=A0AAV3U8L4_9ALTE